MNNIILGDSKDALKELADSSVNVVYMDPPFFTQKTHSLKERKSDKKYKFDDIYDSLNQYLELIRCCLIECRRVLTDDGSIFLHCDKTASHHLRLLLDECFGADQFRSEIIWSYKRWSNSKKGLLNSHQNIYFYSKSSNFKFNTIYSNYSKTTNIDQILQDRVKSKEGVSKYKLDGDGNPVITKEKKGVPLSDVWEIPYLNPKAKERVGYPTQKPVLLLNQIIRISSDEEDVILDPFMGSGTTCISAKHLNRNYIGIDKSKDAYKLCQSRLKSMVITESNLLKTGEDSYTGLSKKKVSIIESIGAFPVRRNSGIDGILDQHYDGTPVPIKVQGKHETIDDALEKLDKASAKRGYKMKILIQTKNDEGKSRLFKYTSDAVIIKASSLLIKENLNQLSLKKFA